MVKSTWTEPTSRGWHIGTRSAVRLAAWMPATLAAASTSPLVMALLATCAVVSGFMATRQRARARLSVASLGDRSTMRVPPNGSRWLKLRSVTAGSLRSRTQCTGAHGPGTALALARVDCQRIATPHRKDPERAHLRILLRHLRAELRRLPILHRRPLDRLPDLRIAGPQGIR